MKTLLLITLLGSITNAQAYQFKPAQGFQSPPQMQFNQTYVPQQPQVYAPVQQQITCVPNANGGRTCFYR